MSTKCMNCGASVFDVPLMRVNEKGVDGVFWCEPCVEKNEPELYKNEKEDETQAEKDLKIICYPDRAAKNL